jgi:hypothetical protein
MPDLQTVVAGNVAAIRERISEAARRAGRSPDEIKLVGVTKYVTPAVAAALVEAGCHDLGESRPQDLWEKADTLRAGASPLIERAGASPPPAIYWHLIGHLQRNKVRRTLPLVNWIHSVDSPRLLKAIGESAAELALSINVLLEVNCSGESAKHGLMPQDVPALLATAEQFPHVAIRGLMTMAALEGGLSVARKNFAALRELRDAIAGKVPDCVRLGELSMGMSGDFEEAIDEGATMVRVGTALWHGVDDPRSHG